MATPGVVRRRCSAASSLEARFKSFGLSLRLRRLGSQYDRGRPGWLNCRIAAQRASLRNRGCTCFDFGAGGG